MSHFYQGGLVELVWAGAFQAPVDFCPELKSKIKLHIQDFEKLKVFLSQNSRASICISCPEIWSHQIQQLLQFKKFYPHSRWLIVTHQIKNQTLHEFNQLSGGSFCFLRPGEEKDWGALGVEAWDGDGYGGEFEARHNPIGTLFDGCKVLKIARNLGLEVLAEGFCH